MGKGCKGGRGGRGRHSRRNSNSGSNRSNRSNRSGSQEKSNESNNGLTANHVVTGVLAYELLRNRNKDNNNEKCKVEIDLYNKCIENEGDCEELEKKLLECLK